MRVGLQFVAGSNFISIVYGIFKLSIRCGWNSLPIPRMRVDWRVANPLNGLRLGAWRGFRGCNNGCFRSWWNVLVVWNWIDGMIIHGWNAAWKWYFESGRADWGEVLVGSHWASGLWVTFPGGYGQLRNWYYVYSYIKKIYIVRSTSLGRFSGGMVGYSPLALPGTTRTSRLPALLARKYHFQAKMPRFRGAFFDLDRI